MSDPQYAFMLLSVVIRDELAAKDARIKELQSEIDQAVIDMTKLLGDHLESRRRLTALQQQFSWRKVSEGLPTVVGRYVFDETSCDPFDPANEQDLQWIGNQRYECWLGPLPEIEQQEHSNDRK